MSKILFQITNYIKVSVGNDIKKFFFSFFDVNISLYLYKYNYQYDVIHLGIVLVIRILKMPIKVFGTSSNKSEHKIDTSFFVQKVILELFIKKIILTKTLTYKINLELKIYLILWAYDKQLQKIMLIIYSMILV